VQRAWRSDVAAHRTLTPTEFENTLWAVARPEINRRDAGTPRYPSAPAGQAVNRRRKYCALAIASGTFLCGAGATLILSVFEGTFWLNSHYDVPLAIIPTMTVGDGVFLPWFNYRAFMAIAAARDNGFRFSRGFTTCLFAMAIVSATLNGTANYAWCHDQFFGATDKVDGHLTMLGWWHFGFSIVQMEIIFLVLGVWISTLRMNSESVHRLFMRSWHILLAFSVFPLFDSALKTALVYKCLSAWEIFSLEKMSALPLLFTSLTLMVLQLARNRQPK
jgi:hypothetical protein